MSEETEWRGGLLVRKGAPVCSVCKDDDTKRLDCRACGGSGLDSLEDVRDDTGLTPPEVKP